MSYTYGLDEIRDYITNENDEFRPNMRLLKGLLIHATLEDRLETIKENGLLPRGLAGCHVWGGDRIPRDVDVEEILVCREGNVFFWDDLYEGCAQAIATVGYLKGGNPGIVIVNVRGFEDKLKFDPEVHRYGEPDREDPIAYMLPQKVPPDRILCTCRLDDEHKPDMGKIACPTIHEKEECPKYDAETLCDEYVYDESKWVCECRKPISEVVRDVS